MAQKFSQYHILSPGTLCCFSYAVLLLGGQSCALKWTVKTLQWQEWWSAAALWRTERNRPRSHHRENYQKKQPQKVNIKGMPEEVMKSAAHNASTHCCTIFCQHESFLHMSITWFRATTVPIRGGATFWKVLWSCGWWWVVFAFARTQHNRSRRFLCSELWKENNTSAQSQANYPSLAQHSIKCKHINLSFVGLARCAVYCVLLYNLT